MANVIATLIVLALVVGIALVWRWASWPCPAWLVPLLENPYLEAIAGAKTVLERAGISLACASWTRDVGLDA